MAAEGFFPDESGTASFVQLRRQPLMSKRHDLVTELSEAVPTPARRTRQNLGPAAATRTGVSRLCDRGLRRRGAGPARSANSHAHAHAAVATPPTPAIEPTG